VLICFLALVIVRVTETRTDARISATLPSSKRKMLTPEKVALRPVGSTAPHAPRWVPEAVQRAATNSSSAITNSTSKRRSGKAERKSAVIRFMPAGPGSACVDRSSWREDETE
jgi:hypothetical protein